VLRKGTLQPRLCSNAMRCAAQLARENESLRGLLRERLDAPLSPKDADAAATQQFGNSQSATEAAAASEGICGTCLVPLWQSSLDHTATACLRQNVSSHRVRAQIRVRMASRALRKGC
jgi:hypothetical protein